MSRDEFPPGVAGQLKTSVYRLIDPRNGETFYVGKGRGNRIFQHAKGDFSSTKDEDDTDLKRQRINEIKAAGLKVGHLVHRHGIDNEEVAYEIEAALIDAYPGLTNQAAGRGSGDYGCRHVEQIIQDYAAEPFDVEEPLVLISMSVTHDEGRSVYDAVRHSWKVSLSNVEQRKLVLANYRGKVLAAFRPTEWLKDTEENFPGWHHNPDRYAFIGEPAEDEVARKYVGKRVPEQYRAKGAANPIRYCDP